MKIGILNYNKEDFVKSDLKNLKRNADLLRSLATDEYSKYILSIYDKIIKDKQFTSEYVYNELQSRFRCTFINDYSNIKEYSAILTPSHENTYHFIKELNNNKEPLTVVCFDMHCDAYNADKDLWKGNCFSKLLKEKYISNLICYGIPRKKILMTLCQMDERFFNQLFIAKSIRQILRMLKKTSAKHIIFSVDLDCFDTYNSNYTAVPYSPYRVLNELSHKRIKSNITAEELAKIAESCVYIKNKYGYENMFHVGENSFTIDDFIRALSKIVDYCVKHSIVIGYKNKAQKILLDVTEVEGEDINGKTMNLITSLLNTLKEVSNNERIIFKEIEKNEKTRSTI